MMFIVARREPELVTPAKPTPFESKYLSDIDDQEGLRFRTSVIITYRKNDRMAGVDPVAVIKASLSQALVFYYPFAGRLRERGNRKLMVECTGEGVLFIEADARVTLDQIQHALLPPCTVLEDVLFDIPESSGIIDSPLLLFQVTRLICGGFILGVGFNHAFCDISGVLKLLNAMVELSRGADRPSLQPVWQRDIFKARDPPIITHTHHEYDEGISTAKGTVLDHLNSQATDQHSLCFSPKEIQSLRNNLSPHLRHTCTKFELLSACVWKCRTIALQPNPEDLVRYSCVTSLGNKRGTSIPPGFYGNTLVYPTIITEAKQLIENSLDYALKLVQESKAKATEEYARSAADFLVLKGKPKYVEKLHWIASNTMSPVIRNMDFGWGTAVFVVAPRGLGIISNFSTFNMRGVEKEEEIVVVALELPTSAMIRLREEVNKMLVTEQAEPEDKMIGHKDVEKAIRSRL